MKYVLIRSQLVLVSLMLFATFSMMMAIVDRYNQRWDTTHEKIYSLAEQTVQILEKLKGQEIEITAFYPQEDPARANFELFLKECRLRHPKLKYTFVDPDRAPALARQFHIQEIYTVILKGAGRQERIVQPTEERFAGALLRLAHPRKYEVCFITGHDEPSINRDDRTGYQHFREVLESYNYGVREIILARDKVPPNCHVLAIAGPHRDLDGGEYGLLKQAFSGGQGIFFLIDPMDTGTGVSFTNFLREFGVVLGTDVIVDKMSRMVGGDFLVPLVSQYMTEHPVTATFEKPTFLPVARSVQPSTDNTPDLEIVPLALSGSGSWAEMNLSALEKGEAAFEAESDLAGPIPVSVAVESKVDGKGRMVIVGDRCFLSNAYLGLSGNQDLALNMMEWLVKDDRFISIRPRMPDFQPLLLAAHQATVLLVVCIGVVPGFFLIAGVATLLWRKKVSA